MKYDASLMIVDRRVVFAVLQDYMPSSTIWIGVWKGVVDTSEYPVVRA